MALSYDDVPNGLFIQLGKIAKHYHAQAADASALDTDLGDIAGVFEAMTSNESELLLDGFPSVVTGWQSQYVSRRASLAALATKRLQDRATVIDELRLENSQVASVLSALIRQMADDSESVNASTVTIGAVTADSGNIGNGSVLTTKILDGVTSPGRGAAGTYPAHPAYRGRNSELAVPSETMTLTCATANSGNETFAWHGRQQGQAHGFRSEGSGSIGTIGLAHATSANLLQNASFENFTGDQPANWTIDAGTAGTHVVEETNGADVYHGSSSLRLTGDGALAAITLSQAIAANRLQANRMYCVTARIKADASITAGDLTIQFRGTGYTPGDSESIEIEAGDLPTDWTLVHFFAVMPAVIPADFALEISWSDTPDNAKQLWIDDLSLSAVHYGGGIGVVLVRGTTPPVVGDRYTFTVANDDAGVFQKFFRQVYGVQLPSDDSGSETIDDSLAS